jgi:hypothetical protein
MGMSLSDGAIHASRKTKIIGVNDQAAHRVSLAGMNPQMRRVCIDREPGKKRQPPNGIETYRCAPATAADALGGGSNRLELKLDSPKV